MGRITIDQSHAIIAAILANTRWDDIDFEMSGLQDSVIRNQKEAGRQFTEFLKMGGRVSLTDIKHLIDCDSDPFLPSGWKVEEHKKGGQIQWNPQKVKLYLPSGQENWKPIEGNKLRKELEGKPVLNANVLDYLLTNPHLIPLEWKGKAVFFWGTIYCHAGGDLCARYLCWNGSGWDSDCGWLRYSWDGYYPAVVLVS